MFDIGFPELVLVAIVGLLVIGPERLPEALRTLGLWLGRMRRSFMAVKNEIEKEIGMDEVRRQLHNEAIMEEMKRIENEVKATASDVNKTMNDTANRIDPRPMVDQPAAITAPSTSENTDQPATTSERADQNAEDAAATPRTSKG